MYTRADLCTDIGVRWAALDRTFEAELQLLGKSLKNCPDAFPVQEEANKDLSHNFGLSQIPKPEPVMLRLHLQYQCLSQTPNAKTSTDLYTCTIR